MNNFSKCLMALASWAAVGLAHGQITNYVFTAVVVSNGADQQPSNNLVGTYVTGTFTFNYNAADQVIAPYGFLGGATTVSSTGLPYNPVWSYSLSGVPGFGSGTRNGATSEQAVQTTMVNITNWNISATVLVGDYDESAFMTFEADPEVAKSGNFACCITGPGGGPKPFTGSQRAYFGTYVPGAAINWKITSLSYAPGPTPSSLFSALAAEVNGVGQGQALPLMVQLAQTYYNDKDLPDTCNSMTKFLSYVQEFQNAQRIPAAQGADLTANGQALAATIGCTK